jgi:hypothetical protein
MANALYPKWKEAIVQATANSSLGGTVKVALVDTGTYTYSSAHEFQSSLSGVVGTAVTLGSKTFTNGLFDAADSTFTAVSGATAEALVIYVDTGSSATSRLVAYIDTGVTGLPVTPNGGDIIVQWNASGIFQL